MINFVASFFNFWNNKVEKQILENNEILNFIHIFSLLENVFRNVLLRPYIPVYRTIDKNCGRYHSYVTDFNEILFKMFNFQEKSSNLLIYYGNDVIETIVYAITCIVFWHSLQLKLKFNTKQN